MEPFFIKITQGHHDGVGGQWDCSSRSKQSPKPALNNFKTPDEIYIKSYPFNYSNDNVDKIMFDTNFDFINVLAEKNNKLTHTTNGNTTGYSIAQINTGNGNWAKNDMLLLCAISRLDPDLVIISESNFDIMDSKLAQRCRNLFQGYIILDKVFQGTRNARLSVLIKENLTFQRMISSENEINPAIIIKLKMANNRYHCTVSNYRQWKGTSPQCHYNTRNDQDCISRFSDMITMWKKSAGLGYPTYICGDINIDRLEENDPMRRNDLRNLIPLLNDFQSSNNFSLVNKKATRQRVNQRPSLLDLILTN